MLKQCTEGPEKEEVWWCLRRIIPQNTDIDLYFLLQQLFFPPLIFCDIKQRLNVTGVKENLFFSFFFFFYLCCFWQRNRTIFLIMVMIVLHRANCVFFFMCKLMCYSVSSTSFFFFSFWKTGAEELRNSVKVITFKCFNKQRSIFTYECFSQFGCFSWEKGVYITGIY